MVKAVEYVASDLAKDERRKDGDDAEGEAEVRE